MLVAPDGTGDFRTIQEALLSIPYSYPERVEIYIKPGLYREKIHVNKANVSFKAILNDKNEPVIIVYGDHARKTFRENFEFGTFNSASILITAPGFTAEDITFRNDAGLGSVVGQALAVYAEADRLCFRRCVFEGRQDTLFLGPLPPSPRIPGSFKGPTEFAPRAYYRSYFEECTLEGDIDFIFGSACAFFWDCTINSLALEDGAESYVCAPSTPDNQAYGFVFQECRFGGSAGQASVYLARPWREFAQAVFLNCWMGNHIKPEGFHDWDNEENRKTATFAEYHSEGPGAHRGKRAEWVRELDQETAASYSRRRVLAGDDSWAPWLED